MQRGWRASTTQAAAVYERLGIPTVATVPWTTDRLLNALVRGRRDDPSGAIRPGNVAVAEVLLHDDWLGTVTDLEGPPARGWRS